MAEGAATPSVPFESHYIKPGSLAMPAAIRRAASRVNNLALLALTTKQSPTSSINHGGGKRRSGMVGSGRPFHLHHTKSGVKVYVDV